MNEDETELQKLIGKWLFVASVLGFTVFLSTRISNIAGGADPSCYLELNRMFMNGKLTVEMRQVGTIPFEEFPRNAYVSIGLREMEEGYLQGPTAFPGYPLVISALDVFFPQELAVWLSILLISAGVCIVTYLLIRSHGLSPSWACFGSAAMGLSPIMAIIGAMPIADYLSCLLALACWLLSTEAHKGKWIALGLGACLGLAVITRPNNLMFFAPVIVTLLFNLKKQEWWWVIGAGGLPFAGFLFWFNNAVYGSPFVTDYDRHKDDFGAEHVWPTIEQFSIWMWDSILPVAFILLPLSVVFIKGRVRDVTTLWAWIIAIFALPAFFSEARGQFWNLRYTLPAWPAILLGAAIGGAGLIRFATNRWKRTGWLHWLSIAIAISAGVFGVNKSRGMHLYGFKQNESANLHMADWINENTQDSDVLLAFQVSGTVQYYTDRAFLRWERLESEHWKRLKQNSVDEGYRIYAVIFVYEFKDAETLGKRFPGKWEGKATFGAYTVYELSTPN